MSSFKRLRCRALSAFSAYFVTCSCTRQRPGRLSVAPSLDLTSSCGPSNLACPTTAVAGQRVPERFLLTLCHLQLHRGDCAKDTRALNCISTECASSYITLAAFSRPILIDRLQLCARVFLRVYLASQACGVNIDRNMT